MGQFFDDSLRLQMKAMRSSLVKSFLEAKIRADEAAASLNMVMDLPHSDRAQRIDDAARKLSIARNEMIEAHRCLADFVERDGLRPGLTPVA